MAMIICPLSKQSAILLTYIAAATAILCFPTDPHDFTAVSQLTHPKNYLGESLFPMVLLVILRGHGKDGNCRSITLFSPW